MLLTPYNLTKISSRYCTPCMLCTAAEKTWMNIYYYVITFVDLIDHFAFACIGRFRIL
jgi:hypothetical protein